SIQTFIGQSITTPGATLAMDYTVHGLHASVYSPSGSWYIDPYYKLETDVHVSYFRQDLQKTINHLWTEQLMGDHQEEHQEEESVQVLTGTGTQLRTYDLAMATTAEYTNQTGGTQQTALGAVTTNVVRLNQIYERDFAVRFQLVANELNILFTNATDPYGSPSNAGTTASQNQGVVDGAIGSANYDIGHVLHRVTNIGLSNGVAQLGSVGVAGQKAIGYTCHSLTTGDFITIDFLAHEMGHQFAGRHSYNSVGQSQGDSSSLAVETGAGITIMGYAGLGDSNENVTSHSDAMFHAINMSTLAGTAAQTLSFILGTSSSGNTSATKTNTGNTPPVANAGSNYTIPSRTPFILTASATDANDPLGQLTYSWEQMNGGAVVPIGTFGGVQAVPNYTNEQTSGPTFRTYVPTSNASRMFPLLDAVRLGRTYARGEFVPTVTRTMNFTVVVRDNFAGGGGTSLDQMVLNTVNTGAAFAITNLNSATVLQGNASQLLTWDVAGTTANGINAASVNIYLSTDNGATFGTLLAGNVANDGSETLTIPNIATNAGRIIIQPTNNIFFDMNNGVLTIQQSSLTSVIPTVPDLDFGSDTGTSNSDNITRFNNANSGSALSLTVGSTVAGALIEVLYGATVIGSATATGTSTTVVTNGAFTLPDGPVALTARQTEPGKTASSSTSSLNITVDTVGPGTNAGFDREQTQDIVVSYSEDISASLTSGDFSVMNLSTGQPAAITSFSAGASTATLGFTGILPNGHYQLDLFSSSATDVAGNTLAANLSFTFDVLAGDANGDGTVNFADLLIVAQQYEGPGTLFSQGDFNFDDDINFADLLICAQNYNVSLAQARPMASLSAGRQSTAASIGLVSTTKSRASGESYNRSVIA
ncbi:MAG TPA: M12 family metallo-peptidase, partial [Tepidisphaeraceae bacterium]|nr:M12 family metallo-peptidase [Tepidisphaeraceae bacterium]